MNRARAILAWRGKGRLAVSLLLAGVVAAIAVVALRRVGAELEPHRVFASLRALSPWHVGAAIGLTACSYAMLTCYDMVALRVIGARVARSTTARAAFTNYALSHTLGFGAITGGSARLRIYGAAGVPPVGVARVIVISGLAFWGGVATLAVACLALVRRPLELAGLVVAPAQAHALAAGFAGLALAGGLALRASPRLRARVHRVLPLPAPRQALLLLGVSALDLFFASMALYVLVPGLPPGSFETFYLIYALAIAAGLVTHVPGGLGVFEAVVLAALPHGDSGAIAALIAYRVVYYLLPLTVALVLNALIEAGRLKRVGRLARTVARAAVEEISPFVFAAMVFGGGLVLLLSGVTPPIHSRMHVLAHVLPLPFINASHLFASLVGTTLLLVAPALASRLESGRRIAIVLLGLGAAFSLAKGLDFEEAGLMVAMAGMLKLAAPAFYRKTQGAFSTHNRGWLAAAAIAVALATWSGLEAHRHVAYDSLLWWEFALHGDASRFLRASFATGILVAAFGVREIMFQPHADGALSELPHGVFARATSASGRSDAALAFVGDKRFLVHEAGDAFIMFRPKGHTWVVMGDPVGPVARWHELAWDLRRHADACNARIAFYQASEAMLPLIVELGLSPMKYGEEAHVDVRGFSLEGPRMKSLRNGFARAQREGLRFRIVPRAEVWRWLPRLRPLSDAWLKAHGSSEKSFSLGNFSAGYLAHFDLALVLGEDGVSPVAFANVWRAGDGEELSVDLMRQRPGAPAGTMDYLFVQLVEHARATGCRRFNLGLSPLSGMPQGRLVPGWARLARIAASTEALRYNFAGLRRYKQKFAPAWQGRYVAIPRAFAGLRALVDIVSLVNAGQRGGAVQGLFRAPVLRLVVRAPGEAVVAGRRRSASLPDSTAA